MAAKKNVTLHGFPMSTTTHIALIAALESGVSVRLENVVLFSGEHKAKSYIETLNPFGRIPTLVDGDLVLYESRAIMKHLALSYSTPGTLVPVDTAARVQMEKLVSIELSYFSPTLIKAVAPMVNVELGFAAAVDEAAVTSSLNNADVLITIDLLEATLLASAATGEPFLVGNAMTLAECAYFTWIFWFEFFYDRNDNAGVYGSTKAGRFFADADRFPTIRQWWAALKSRPSAQLVAREACRTFEMALAKGAHDKVVEYSL